MKTKERNKLEKFSERSIFAEPPAKRIVSLFEGLEISSKFSFT
jgi:hypothetical protein